MNKHHESKIGAFSQSGANNGYRCSRYLILASEYMRCVPGLLAQLRKHEPRGGYPDKRAVQGILQSDRSSQFAPRQRGAADDLLRTLLEHGVVLYDPELTDKRYLFDPLAAERFSKAILSKTRLAPPSTDVLQARMRELYVSE